MSTLEPDDLDAGIIEYGDALVVDGLSSLLAVCERLRERRIQSGLSLIDVIQRSPCAPMGIEWVDEGDVAAPAEALIYYAAAVGLAVEFAVEDVDPVEER